MDLKTNIISIISALFALVICGLIYLRMIKREVPEPIGKLQAILPVILGGICVLVSGPAGIGLLYAFKSIGVTGETMAPLPASFFTAFFIAGGVEELFKFLAIIITIVILKNKVKNVYEYIILGAAVGFGFTVVEDLLAGQSITNKKAKDRLHYTGLWGSSSQWLYIPCMMPEQFLIILL